MFDNDGYLFIWMWFVASSWMFIGNLINYKKENLTIMIVMGIISLTLGYFLFFVNDYRIYG